MTMPHAITSHSFLTNLSSTFSFRQTRGRWLNNWGVCQSRKEVPTCYRYLVQDSAMDRNRLAMVLNIKKRQ